MLFNSYVFIFAFLPIAVAVFFCLGHRSARLAVTWLTVASLFFYGFWKISYLPLLLISIVGNYVAGQLISRCRSEGILAKLLLVSGILVNLLFIGYYKYAGFLIASVNGSLGIDISIPEIFLPLAISFYTFTQIAYLVDAYRGEIRDKQYSLVTYTLFVTFFPQLIAGPILHHDELIPQLQENRIFAFSSKNFALGLLLFILGLSKKVLIADNLSPWVATVFNDTSSVGLLSAWVGALSYAFQLYFDFSGYSDMAIGLGWMFNIQLPINFNSPYKAKSIIDFWRRWHITLSNFLRDYLYIPLGGSRCGKVRHYSNLFLTMLLGGLWHGAGWTFVFWGGLHGSYLVINHWWRKRNIPMPALVSWGITFVAVLISWVFFRAKSFADAITLLQAMIGMNGIELPSAFPSLLHWGAELGVKLVVLAILLVCVLRLPNAQEIVQLFKPKLEWVVVIATIATASLLSLNRVSEFLYFQF